MGKNSAGTILRWGLAFIFFYAAVASLLRPESWLTYFPQFLKNILPSHILLVGFSFYELILAALLFWGRKLAQASILAAITLGVIIVFNLDSLDAVFLDAGLLMAALALFEIIRNGKKNAEGNGAAMI